MKFKSIYMLISLSIIISACSSSDEDKGRNKTPTGTQPSAEFTLNNLPKEPYHDDAVLIVAEEKNSPFYSLELIPDGTYLLLTKRPENDSTEPVHVATKSDGGFSLYKNAKTSTRLIRSTTNDNGTNYFKDGEYGEYGTFEKIGNKRYRLSGGIEFYMEELGSSKIVICKHNDIINTVYVTEYASVVTNATNSLCRTWNSNTTDVFLYFNDKYVASGKQTVENGRVYTQVDGMSEIGEEEMKDIGLLDYDDEVCYKAIFTRNNTYICFYLGGDIELRHWKWDNEAQGILYWNAGSDDYGHSTIRFAGNQMRTYEDYTFTEEGTRMQRISTFTAAN